VKKLVVLLLVIPLVIVIVVENPQAAGHVVQVIITFGARLLIDVASFFVHLFSHSHK
jgi:hypothetical protein